MAPETAPSPSQAARGLLRAARSAALGTVVDGQPFVSLVTPATAPDLSVLLLLSSLSEHTRHLVADARCSVLVAGAPAGANPQTAPRLSLTGRAEPELDPAAKARWLAVHPYAAVYAGFGDFALWCVRPEQALFVGGFATARRLRRGELVPDPAAVAAVAAAAEAIMEHCNTDHSDALRAIARRAGGAGDAEWRMVGVDVDGCDLMAGEDVRRVAWLQPASGPAQVRAELVGLARTARVGG
jgi:heme iron utilization protein